MAIARGADWNIFSNFIILTGSLHSALINLNTETNGGNVALPLGQQYRYPAHPKCCIIAKNSPRITSDSYRE